MAVKDAASMSLLMALVPVASIISIAITVPLNGALTRWRVHYNTQGRIQLPGDEAGEARAQTSSSGPDGFFSTLKRVHRIEGWAGLYKGFSPAFIGVLFMLSVLAGMLGLSKITLSGKVKHIGVFGYVVETILGIIVGIPLHVITVRSIVTPYKLPYFNPLLTARILLSPLERRQPWRIYLLPGLFVSHIAIFLLAMVVPLFKILLFPVTALPFLGIGALVYFIIAVLLASVQTPLYVAYSRLAVQRARGVDEQADQVDDVELYSGTEDVITIRDDTAGREYTSLVDCIQTMKAEEGWNALFRAWWITFIGVYFSASWVIGGASIIPK